MVRCRQGQSRQEPQYQTESQRWAISRTWGSVPDNSEVPALLGLRTIEKLHGIIDTRIGQRKLYICDNPDDITITVRPSARDVHVLQLVQAPS
eukprot:7206443-Prorocentrum_lima.AAC.1